MRWSLVLASPGRHQGQALDAEAPVDAGLSLVSFQFQGVGLPAEGFLVGETLLQARTGQYAALYLPHPFGRLRTGFSQLPCLGVW